MSWLYQHKKFHSHHNGEIVVRRVCGVWSVSIHGINYISDYLRVIWETVLKEKVRLEDNKMRHILLLGLGAGQQIKTLHTLFPDCTIDAIEIDPTMVEITHYINLYNPHTSPAVTVGDIRKLLPVCTAKYDIVLFDTFDGTWKQDEVTNMVSDMLPHIMNTLAACGVCMINIQDKDASFLQKNYASSVSIMKYKWNTIAVLEKNGAGSGTRTHTPMLLCKRF
jgi:spermidine synthase